MIHAVFSGHGCWKSLLGVSCTGVDTPDCGFRAGGLLLLSLSESLSGVCVSFRSPASLLKSRAEPGVFGVFVAEAPNDAKAPLPSPKAEEPVAVVGEETDEVETCPMGLKELFFEWLEVVLPKRLEEAVSGLSLLVDCSPLFVERLSLLLLQGACAVSDWIIGSAAQHGWTYFERRVHRLDGLLSSF
jgi:hypothetical protein